jgi:DHA1 family bicyclomycin/chloramphenicol resistance-like MFS transporter
MFLQSIFNSLVAGMIAPALWGSTRTLSFGMGTLMLVGAASAWLHNRLAARSAAS